MAIISLSTSATASPWLASVNLGEDRYWDLVKDALQKIFGESSTKAADDLRHDVAQIPHEEQIIFYHAEPIDVAADIAGKAPEAHHIQQYQKLVKDRFTTWGIS
jgi:hypothetical protein